jgi:general secretion pathway protein K
MKTYQKGIALFQILLMTAVISILALQFTQTARNQVAIASIMNDRLQAQTILKTVESELLFALFTENRYQNPSSDNPYVQNWNFFGERFEPANSTPEARIELKIQDLNGLIGLYQGRGHEWLAALLESLNDKNTLSENIDVSTVINSMIDWQDSDDLALVNGAERGQYEASEMPSNLPFQNYSEFQYVKGVSAELHKYLQPLTTVRSQRYFNPMLAPNEILTSMLDEDRVNEIIRLRRAGQLSINKFTALSGFETDESLMFFPSGLLRIDFSVKVAEVSLKKSIEIYLQPYDKHPYLEYEIRL